MGQKGLRVLSTVKLDLFLNSRAEAGAAVDPAAPALAEVSAAGFVSSAGLGGRTAKTEPARRKARRAKV
jgi:hypothetical protein